MPFGRIEWANAIEGNDQVVVVAGMNGHIFELNGPSFELITKYTTNPPETKAVGWDEMVDVWGTEDGTVIATGSFGTVLVRHPDGSIQQWDTQDLIHPKGLSPVWGFKDYWYPHRPWTRVWGSSGDNVYIAGHGAVRRWDGEQWHDIAISGFGKNSLVKTLHGTGPNDVYLGGNLDNDVSNDGFVAHFDGAEWTLEVYPGMPVRALWGRSPDEWFMADALGVYRREAGSWVQIGQHTCPDTCYLIGLPTGELVKAFGRKDGKGLMGFRYMTPDGAWYLAMTHSSWLDTFDLHPTFGGNFFAVDDDWPGRLFHVDRQKLTEIAKSKAWNGNVFSNQFMSFMKPLVSLPGFMYAAWEASSGQLWFAAPHNGLYSSP